MAAQLALLEKKVDALILWQASIDEWRETLEKNTRALNNMVELFERIEASLWLFVKIGNAVKWIVTISASAAAAVVATKYVLKEWLLS